MHTNPNLERKLIDMFEDFSGEKNLDELSYTLKGTRLEGILKRKDLPDKSRFHVVYLSKESLRERKKMPIYHASIELGAISKKDKEIFRKFYVTKHSYDSINPFEQHRISKTEFPIKHAPLDYSTAFMKIHIDDNSIIINPLQLNSGRKKSLKRIHSYIHDITQLESDILYSCVSGVYITPRRTILKNMKPSRSCLHIIDTFIRLEKAKIERDKDKAEWYHRRIYEAIGKNGDKVDLKRLIAKDKIKEALGSSYWSLKGHHGPKVGFTEEDKKRILNKYSKITVGMLLRKYARNFYLSRKYWKRAYGGLFDYQRSFLLLPLAIDTARKLNKSLYIITPNEICREWGIKPEEAPFSKIYEHIGSLVNEEPKKINTRFLRRKIEVYPLFINQLKI